MAQTFADWEALIVDDGSTDGTSALLDVVRDPRLRCVRLEVNQGRGAARQRALSMARGKYLAMLDADDWLFPSKLERQVALMEAYPELSVVAHGCAITGHAGQLVGESLPTAESTPVVRRMDRFGASPVPFPPAMIRLADISGARFDHRLLRSQDSDFLLQFMVGRDYALVSEPLYAYSQAEAASLEKTLEGYRFRIQSYAKHLRRHPVRAAAHIGQTLFKASMYRAASQLGCERALIERRWRPYSSDTRQRFDAARAIVARVRNDLFRPAVLPAAAVSSSPS